jgi:hypothetical protein
MICIILGSFGRDITLVSWESTDFWKEHVSNFTSLEIRECGRGDPLRWPCDILYSQKLALPSPISGGRSVGLVRSRTKATEFSCLLLQARRPLDYFNGDIISRLNIQAFQPRPFRSKLYFVLEYSRIVDFL